MYGVIAYTSLFKLNKLSSRYSRFSTSRLEIRDSAGERNRSITRDGKYRAKGSRILRYFFRLHFVRLCRFRSHRFSGKSDVTKFDEKTSSLSLSSRYRDAKTIEQEDAQDATSSESPVFIAISEAARFNARVFVDPLFDSLG